MSVRYNTIKAVTVSTPPAVRHLQLTHGENHQRDPGWDHQHLSSGGSQDLLCLPVIFSPQLIKMWLTDVAAQQISMQRACTGVHTHKMNPFILSSC